MPKRKGGSPARPAPPARRGTSSEWIDLLQEPGAIVEAGGALVHLNEAFGDLVSDAQSARRPAAGDPLGDWIQTVPVAELEHSAAPQPRTLQVRARSRELEAHLAPLSGEGECWLLLLRTPAAAPATRDISLLQEVAQVLTYALDPLEVFRHLLDCLARTLEYEVGVCVWTGGSSPSGLLRLEVPAEVAVLDRELDAVARELEIPWNPRPALSVERSLRYRTHDRPFAASPTFHLAAPLHRAGSPAGLLLLASTSPGLPTEENRRLLLGVANQVSATLERLEATRAAETGKFQAIIDSMPAGVLLLDASGRVRLSNASARALLEELASPPHRALRSIGDIDLSPLIAAVIRRGDLVRGMEARRAEKILELSLNRVRGGSFDEPLVLLVAEDVTEQRRVQEQLMQSEKLSSLGEMLSGVAHELNNPLATVMGYAQLLLEAEAPAEIKRMLQVVDSEAERCQRIVQSLLAFARRRAPERRGLAVGELVNSAVELVTYGMRSEGVSLEVDVEEGLPPVLGDAHQLQQVFVNVLNNACQAMEEVRGPRRIGVSARREAGGVRLEFSDTGPGIPPQHLPRIFDPFFTTKEVGKGTGLGLSLAYGIAAEHGGSIEARNNPGGGACFTVRLPAASGPLQEQAREVSGKVPEAAPATVGQRILIVDDEDLLASVMREALVGEGYGVEVAHDGEEALRRLGEATYDLIITDVKMPTMGGRELHREILRVAPTLAGRVLFSTGDVVNPATLRFFEETRSRYITKPFKLSELRRVVRSMLGAEQAGA